LYFEKKRDKMYVQFCGPFIQRRLKLVTYNEAFSFWKDKTEAW